eukprot:10685471-Lingulodinium_polyedra.AAC.1
MTPHFAHARNFVLGSETIVDARSPAAHPGDPAAHRGALVLGLPRRFLGNNVNGPVKVTPGYTPGPISSA